MNKLLVALLALFPLAASGSVFAPHQWTVPVAGTFPSNDVVVGPVYECSSLSVTVEGMTPGSLWAILETDKDGVVQLPVGQIDSSPNSIPQEFTVSSAGFLVTTAASTTQPAGAKMHFSCINNAGIGGGGSPNASVDYDGDGLYDYVRFPQDFDGDGTTWQTCDCGGSTTPGFSAEYICGFYRTSATDATPADYTSGDSASNPASCRFHGERVWNDTTDDSTALHALLEPGATIYVEEGIYPMLGAESTGADANDCWDSTAGAWGTDNCAVVDGVATSAVLLRKNGLTLTGAGADANGERNLVREGAYFVRNRGLRADWGAAETLQTRVFCTGYTQLDGEGGCGVGIVPDAGAVIELTYPQGQCIDRFDLGSPKQISGSPDGRCDTNSAWFVGGGGTKGSANLSHQICVDNFGGYADGLVEGSTVILSSTSVSGAESSILGRVDVQGAAGSCNTNDRLITLAATQGLRDTGDTETHGLYPSFTVYGRSDGSPLEDASGPDDASSTIFGPIDPDKIVGNILVESITVAHQDYAGSGSDSDGLEARNGDGTSNDTPDAIEACEDGTEDGCDQGVLITVGSAANVRLSRIALVHSNSAVGSGSSLDFAPNSTGAVIEDSILAYGVGGSLVDMSTFATLRNNVIMDNAITTFEGQAGDFLIDNQGGFFNVTGNTFVRNYIHGTTTESGLLGIFGYYSHITDNTFVSSGGPCVSLRPGTAWSVIARNTFDCGSFGSSGSIRPSIAIVGGGRAVERIDHVLIKDNVFSSNAVVSTAGALGHIHYIGTNTDIVNPDDIGLGGVRIIDNMMGGGMAAAFDSSVMLLIADDNDPDNARFYLEGNTLEGSGGNDDQATRVAAQDSAASGQWHWITDNNNNPATDGTAVEGFVPRCGVNWLDGVATGTVAGSCAGVTFP